MTKTLATLKKFIIFVADDKSQNSAGLSIKFAPTIKFTNFPPNFVACRTSTAYPRHNKGNPEKEDSHEKSLVNFALLSFDLQLPLEH